MKKALLLITILLLPNIVFSAQKKEIPSSPKRTDHDSKLNADSEDEKTQKLREILTELARSEMCYSLNAEKFAKAEREIKAIFESGLDVNIKVKRKRTNIADTVLMEIARYRELTELAKWLINLGADVNIKSHHGEYTTLHQAAINSNVELTAFLIVNGANVNAIAFDASILTHVFSQHQFAFGEEITSKWMYILYLLLINGANSNDSRFQEYLNNPRYVVHKRCFEQLLQKIKFENIKKGVAKNILEIGKFLGE